MVLNLNLLIVLILIGGWISGKITSRLKLPAVLGMTLWGIAISIFFRGNYPPIVSSISPFLKSLALIIILLRAGLGIDRKTLSIVGARSILMGILPCLFEAAAIVFLARWFFHFDWIQAVLTGFLLAAVSPAVVVPSMIEFRERRLGEKKRVPTMILAAASLDDILAITVISLILGSRAGTVGDINIIRALVNIPLSVFSGIVSGVLLGFLLVFLFHRFRRSIAATEKVLLIMGLSVLLVELGNIIHASTLLGLMTAGFVILERAEQQAHELSEKLKKAWVFAEILLFVLIGMSVDMSVVISAGPTSVVLIFLALLFRGLGVLVALAKSSLSVKERMFCVISYIPKATVQAAFGALPLALGVPGGEIMLTLAVVAIITTAPLGMVAIRIAGPRLLELSIASDQDAGEP